MTATGVGSTLSDNRQTLEKVAGIAIIAMGVCSWWRCSCRC